MGQPIRIAQDYRLYDHKAVYHAAGRFERRRTGANLTYKNILQQAQRKKLTNDDLAIALQVLEHAVRSKLAGPTFFVADNFRHVDYAVLRPTTRKIAAVLSKPSTKRPDSEESHCRRGVSYVRDSKVHENRTPRHNRHFTNRWNGRR